MPPRITTPRRQPGAAALAGHRRKATALRERLIVGAVVCCGLAAAVFGARHVVSRVQESRAKEAMVGTFERMHAKQDAFRVLNARFATWAELAAHGAQLPPRQAVHHSSADQSHWYLSLRDRETGLVCDRIGELLDERDTVRVPTCRPSPAGIRSDASDNGFE